MTSQRQRLLWITTERNSIRAEAVGWGSEDGRAIRQGCPIGLSSRGERVPTYPTVMHAIGDGWRLMGPPVREVFKNETGEWIEWEWWLEQIVPLDSLG